MDELTYLVRIKHKEKGIGYTAKTALQKHQKQETSKITKAQFHVQPSSKKTLIEVTVNDSEFRETIEAAITKSGRTPTSGWEIESIEVLSEGEAYKEKYLTIRKERDDLQGENEQLNRRIRLEKPKIETPLEGLLAFFETIDHSADIMLDDADDLEFTRRVMSGQVQDTFRNYVNYILGKNYSEEDIEAILSYEPVHPEEMQELESRYEVAKRELEYLNKIESETSDIPDSLREEYIKIIQSKNHPKTIEEYEAIMQESD